MDQVHNKKSPKQHLKFRKSLVHSHDKLRLVRHSGQRGGRFIWKKLGKISTKALERGDKA